MTKEQANFFTDNSETLKNALAKIEMLNGYLEEKDEKYQSLFESHVKLSRRSLKLEKELAELKESQRWRSVDEELPNEPYRDKPYSKVLVEMKCDDMDLIIHDVRISYLKDRHFDTARETVLR